MSRLFLPFIFLLLLTSCSAVSVRTDYDADAPLSEVRTYQYQNEGPTGLSELDERRLYRMMDSVLTSKGWRKKPLPDVIIDVQAELVESSGNAVGVGVGGTGGQVGGGVQVGIPLNGRSQKRRITFLVVDFREQEVIWEARALGPFSENWKPSQREEQLRKLVLKTLDKYPFESNTP
jgi:hypothetical protein